MDQADRGLRLGVVIGSIRNHLTDFGEIMNRERRRLLLAAIGLIPTSWMLRRERALHDLPSIRHPSFRLENPLGGIVIMTNGEVRNLHNVRGSLRAIPHESLKTPAGRHPKGR